MWDRLTCVTPSALIVSTAEAKANMREDFADRDTLIAGLIASAQATLEGPKGIGEALGPSTWRLSLDAFDDVIAIPLGPVTAIDEITYVDAAGATQTLATSEYLADFDKRPCRLVPTPGKPWPVTRVQPGAVKITFKAGPATPAKDLTQVVLLMVAHWYANPEGAGEVPPAVRNLLERRGPAAI